MRRTREWWAALNRQERVELVALERNDKRGSRSVYIPDDCAICGHCGTACRDCVGTGLCLTCEDRLYEIIAKADRAMEVAGC